MADTHARGHSYHLIDPSPWPAVGSVGALVTAFGLVFYMHDVTPWLLVIGSAILVYTMIGWWRDVIDEGEHRGDHTPVVQIGLRYGMVLFIASEVMFFVAWFWAFFDASIYHGGVENSMEMIGRAEHTGGQWPPVDVTPFNPWTLPFLNTIILLTSGTTVTWAHHALKAGDRRGLILGLWLTILLGATFTGVQAYEYVHATFTMDGGIYGSTFFMATGFHGAHVLIGTCFLAVCLGRAYKGHFTPDHHFGFEAAAWYWHFVDVVWLFLFTFIYWWATWGTTTFH
ncbi:MAG: cytochrome c oxidase subunit 3 [Alphaproteobacteria bacterium]|nr:cytochrome c oxidase subunit 3 [Alphaproteobacteria bacterium]